MRLPAQYSWLYNEKAPKMLLKALEFYGLKEVAGANNNPIIMGWAKQTGQSPFYNADSVPWCGLFMAFCAKEAGWKIPSVAVRASEWSTWGNPVTSPMLGDVLVFTRTGGGHVGIYVGEDKDCYHVLGGNQGDSVSIIRIEKKRLNAARRASWIFNQPENVRVIQLAPTGAVSQNEA